MEKDEFLAFLSSQCQETEERASDILEYYFYAENNNSYVRYIPPRVGILTLSVIDNYSEKGPKNILNYLQYQYMIELSSRVGDVTLITGMYTIVCYNIRCMCILLYTLLQTSVYYAIY